MATTKKDGEVKDGQVAEPNKDEAEEARLKKGEMVGKVRGQDVDSSHHVYEFTDANTGEPVETHQVIHDVATGVNEDGSLKMGKANETFAKPAEGSDKPKGGADTKQSQGANQGEAGEINPSTGKAPK